MRAGEKAGKPPRPRAQGWTPVLSNERPSETAWRATWITWAGGPPQQPWLDRGNGLPVCPRVVYPLHLLYAWKSRLVTNKKQMNERKGRRSEEKVRSGGIGGLKKEMPGWANEAGEPA